MARKISSSDGFEFFSKRAYPASTIPEVQYPHCKAPAERNASWTGCNRPFCSRLSIVGIRFVPTLPTAVKHERVGTPSSRTVQAPHCPSPQPYLDPVRSRSSRSTLRSVRSESASVGNVRPFTCNSLIVDIGSLIGDNCASGQVTFPEADRFREKGHPQRVASCF